MGCYKTAFYAMGLFKQISSGYWPIQNTTGTVPGKIANNYWVLFQIIQYVLPVITGVIPKNYIGTTPTDFYSRNY